MASNFRDAIVDAQGRSEFVIVVVADIRGFSRFSTRQESPNIAMFIKRFYIRLLSDFFASATFVKPTGDGLLMTFPYNETSLHDVAKDVLESCQACLLAFPTICADDPMINFEVPNALGFGVARGTACCLFSGDETLDYSGHMLNLASRLNDLARPCGIVIDGAFQESVIPESLRDSFKVQKVYVRSIAETEPMPVFYLSEYVQIADSSLVPLSGEIWRTIYAPFSRRKLDKVGRFRVALPTEAKSAQHIRVTMIHPNPKVRGMQTLRRFSDFSYDDHGSIKAVVLDCTKASKILTNASVSQYASIKFKIEFVPRALERSK